jgi:hypothetical protein
VDVLDEYTGHTDPGGAATRRTLDALTITKVSVEPPATPCWSTRPPNRTG